MKNTGELLFDIKEAGIITEKEISLLKTRSNKAQANLWDYDLGDIECTSDQTQKGLNWLKNLYKSPAGKERKNNPFGYREIEVLEDEKAHFYFNGFYNISMNRNRFFVPIYILCGAGTSFEYYVNSDGIQIIG